VAESRTRRGWATVAAILWMAVIFGLSSLPGDAVPGSGYSSLGHFVMYAVLGGLYYAALAPRMGRGRAAVAAVALASLYGVTDEFHQSFVPGRFPDMADWAVDTVGATVGVSVLRWLDRR